MGAKKATSKGGKAKKAASAIGSKLKGALGSKKGSGTRRRGHGPTWWSNKVLVEKLKKRYHKLKYGGR